ncbi:uncharacterized protein GIQ15_02340 [Arthroderma uncinatum]|uniref:uncharacterized protein n=1 Tax=Arthroderma uncinatum TaxID=74035 RepID=UPI00144AF177|nr:uncharacterized protein GIQ15_02340 [Arthroderma uncinatum]KAF3483016.1 hypothetical protein GIQ15_02340 [Arthroderma uncinatum]
MPCWDSPEGSPRAQTPQTIKEYQAQEKRIDNAVKVGQVIFDTFNQVSAERSVGGLEASRWACDHHVYSLAEPVLNQGKNKPQGQEDNKQNNTVNQPHPKRASNEAKMEKKEGPPVVNIDDTEAFMKAVKKINRVGGFDLKAPPAPKAAPIEVKESREPAAELRVTTSTQPVVEDNKCPPAEEEEHATKEDGATEEASIPKDEEEDREHLVTFKTWGTPAERPVTASAPRRIILTGIPVFLRGPARLLALIHGGRIESIVVHTANQYAEVRFCDAAACKAFYDKYPNGIDVDYNGSRGTVFVDMGKEVDIVSSRLLECLDLGATRVVRAIGAPLDVSIAELVELVDGKKWQLEKINDSYEASSKIRTVVFRFCSIDTAVRFRSYLIRMDNWDQANIQFGPDPCETATGIHWD